MLLCALLLVPIVAVVNYLIFCGDWLFDFFRPARVQQRKKTVDFKREAARIKRDQERKPFRHRCEVCGRTFCLEELPVPPVRYPAGFAVESVEYMAHGVCPDCAGKR